MAFGKLIRYLGKTGWKHERKQKFVSEIGGRRCLAQIDMQSFVWGQKYLHKNKHNISKYIHSMPCYFVSNGLEMQMPNETFDLLWNSVPNAELTDSETSSSFGEGGKVATSQKVMDGKSRTTDTTTTNPKTTITTKIYYQEKTKRRCVCDVCGSTVSCKSNLAKHRRTKKCQKFLV